MRKVKYVIPLMLLVSLVVGAQEKESAAGRWSLTPHIGTNLWTAKYGNNNGEGAGLDGRGLQIPSNTNPLQQQIPSNTGWGSG